MTPEGDASMMTYNSALSGEYLNPQTFRIAHAQREAGIDTLVWEDRVRLSQPTYHDICLALGAVATLGTACLFF